jgi:uncharacterized protein YbbC (DUF1343 family)
MLRFRSQKLLMFLALPAVFLAGSVLATTGGGPQVQSSPAQSSLAQSNSSYTAPRTRSGIDILEEENFVPLRGKRVGLVTNQTGIDSQNRRTIDMLAHAPGVRLVALFSPEHGIAGNADAPVSDSTDPATKMPIYSLFGETRRPTPVMLRDIDVLVFDIQDAGVRFYTFITTMAYCMEASAKSHISFLVLDRPDPLGGDVIEGPVLDRDRISFTGYFPMPLRYAMTMGELARMFNAENKIGADLRVVAMKNWSRGEFYDQTGLAWIPPSPNLRDLAENFLYPGIEILQEAGVSVGRGTATPFEMFGAPWIRGGDLAPALTSRKIPGLSFAPARFTPSEAPYKGQECEGVTINLTNRAALRSVQMGLQVADVLHRLYPDQFHLEKIVTLLGSQAVVDRVAHGDDPARIVAGWTNDLDRFRRMREKYLLYH